MRLKKATSLKVMDEAEDGGGAELLSVSRAGERLTEVVNIICTAITYTID